MIDGVSASKGAGSICNDPLTEPELASRLEMASSRVSKRRPAAQASSGPSSKKTRRNSAELQPDRARSNNSPPKKRVLPQVTPPSSRRRSPRNVKNSSGAQSRRQQQPEEQVRKGNVAKRTLHLQPANVESEDVPEATDLNAISPEVTPARENAPRSGQEIMDGQDRVTPRRSPRHTPPMRKTRRLPKVVFDSDEDIEGATGLDEEVPHTERGRASGSLLAEEETTPPVEMELMDLAREQPTDVGDSLEVDREANDGSKFLDAVTTTNTVLHSMFAKMQDMFNARLSTLTTSVVERMDKVDKQFDGVATQLTDIHAIVSKTNTSTKTTDTPLNRFNKILDKLTPSDGLVVNREAYSRILCSIVPFEVLRTARDRDLAKQIVMFRFSTAIQVLLCGKNPKETRKQFREGIGGRHSRFKKNVVLNFIYNVQLNSFGMFSDEDDETATDRKRGGEAEIDKNVVSTGTDQEAPENGQAAQQNSPAGTNVSNGVKFAKMRQPDWLKKGFMLEIDVEHARRVQDYSKSESSRRGRKDMESDSDSADDDETDYQSVSGTLQAPEKTIVKEVPTRRDIARHGAGKIYKLLGKHLNLSRKKCKSAFFEHLGFFMVLWSGAGVAVEQERLSVQWGFPEFEPRDGRLQDLKDTQTKSSGDVNLNDYNSKILGDLYGERKDMIIIISHEVQVTEASGPSKKKRNRTTKRVINKAINVVEAAAKFCTEFAQGSDSERSPLPFLRGHKDALRCILGIAIVFKDLTFQFLDKNCSNGRISDVNNMEVAGVKSGNLRLSDLIPGRSSQIRSLSGTVLRMKDNSYCKLNVGARPPESDGMSTGNGEGGRQVGSKPGMEIEPSQSAGVFAI